MKLRPVVRVPLVLSALLLPLIVGVAAAQAIPFSAPTSYATDGECEYIAAGDFNGDGYVDLVSSNDASLSVFLNDGDGTFASRMDTAWESSPGGLDTGDLDGDGNVDVAVTNIGTNTLRVYWGSGDGTFAAHTDVPIVNNPHYVTTVDLDHDGDLDLAASSLANDGGVSVVLNTGGRAFGTPAHFPMASGTSRVRAADMDLDGNLDLVVLSGGDFTVRVLLGDGTGAFTAMPSFGINVDFVHDWITPLEGAVADVNADGRPDYVVVPAGNDDSIKILPGAGNGSFGSPTWKWIFHGARTIISTDINTDGRPDLVTANIDYWFSGSDDSVSVFPGEPGGVLGGETGLSNPNTYPCDLVAADFDNDGSIDLASADLRNHTISVYLCTPQEPSGSVMIEGGAGATRDRAVQVDSYVGYAIQMRFRVEDCVWGGWQTDATHASWVLPAGDGTKYFEAQYRNALGTITRADSIVLDTTAPTATDDAPTGWQTSSPVAVNLVGDDGAGTGVAKFQYRLDSASRWTEIPEARPAVLVSDDGERELLYRAIDAAGNVGDTESVTVMIDTAAPSTTQTGADAAWHRSPVTVVFSADDETSGVARTECSTDGGTSWTTGTSLTVSDEGTTTIGYRSVDEAGNTEIEKTCAVKIDAGAPTCGDDAPTGWQTSSPVTVNLTGDDGAGTGVAKVQYKLDDAVAWTDGAGAAASVPVSGDGVHTLQYRSVDAAGNKGDIETATVRIDATAPGTTQTGADAAWHRYPTTVVFAATDETSGVARTEYSTDGGATWTSGVAVAVRDAGTTAIQYRSRDRAGNVETASSCAVNIDAQSPTTFAARAVFRKGKKAVFRVKIADAQPCPAGGATVTVRIWTAKGKLMGALPVFTDVQTNAVVSLPWARCKLAKGRYVYNVSATDAAGNPQSTAGRATLIVR